MMRTPTQDKEETLALSSDSSQIQSFQTSRGYQSSKEASLLVRQASLFQQTVVSIALGLIGWYLPRSYISSLSKFSPSPAQTVDGVVIQDPQLLHEVVDPPTVPSWPLIILSIWVPCGVALVLAMFSHDKRIAMLQLSARFNALCVTIGLSEFVTHFLKAFVQRRRPNYYALCGWKNDHCTALPEHIREANLSFPSGHSSLSCTGMTFLIWLGLGVLAGSIWNRKVVHLHRLQCQALCIVLFPASATWYVAATRLVDHWHHPSDVLAGLILGFLVATLCYHLWFPPCWSTTQHPSYPWNMNSAQGPTLATKSGVMTDEETP